MAPPKHTHHLPRTLVRGRRRALTGTVKRAVDLKQTSPNIKSENTLLRDVANELQAEDKERAPSMTVIESSVVDVAADISTGEVVGKLTHSGFKDKAALRQNVLLVDPDGQATDQRRSAAHLAAVLVVENARSLGVECAGYNMDDYIQRTFQVYPEQHEAAKATIAGLERKLERPRLRGSVLRAVNLYPKDANGASDPYVVMNVHTSDRFRYRRPYPPPEVGPQEFVSSCKYRTLNPVWNEEFDIEYDADRFTTLCVSLWDKDEVDQTGGLLQASGVRGVFQGCRDAMKSCCATEVDDFLGRFEVPLSALQNKPTTQSFEMKGRSKRSRVSGAITLSLWVQTHVRDPVNWGTKNLGSAEWPAVQRHTDIVFACCEYDAAHYTAMSGEDTWNGEFSPPSLFLIEQHALQNNLTKAQRIYAHWRGLALYHTRRDLIAFPSLLSKFMELSELLAADRHALGPTEAIDDLQSINEDVLACSVRLLAQLFSAFERNEDGVNALVLVLTLVRDVFVMNYKFPLEDFELQAHIHHLLERALQESVVQQYAIECVIPDSPDLESYEGKDIVEAIKSTRSVQDTLVAIHNVYGMPIKRMSGVDLYKIAVVELDKLLALEVQGTCQVWSRRRNIPVTLFRLFFAVKRLEPLYLAEAQNESLILLRNYHTYFAPLAKRWISQMQDSILQWVQRAIESDTVVEDDDQYIHSTSVIDVFSALSQVWEFWDRLQWPKGSFEAEMTGHVAQIICSGIVAYTSTVFSDLKEKNFFCSAGKRGFEVTQPLCVALNNFHAVKREIKTMSTLTRVGEAQAAYEASPLFHASVPFCLTKRLFDEAADNVRFHVKNVLVVVAQLVWRHGAEILQGIMASTAVASGVSITDFEGVAGGLLDYINESLVDFSTHLEEKLFQRLSGSIWEQFLKHVHRLMVPAKGAGLLQPQMEFVRLLVHQVHLFFHQNGQGIPEEQLQCNTLDAVNRVIDWYFDLSTYDLVHTYLQEEAKAAGSRNNAGTIELKVQCERPDPTAGYVVRVTVGAATLTWPEGKDAPSSYIKLRLFPAGNVNKRIKRQTKTQKHTTTPVWNQTFELATDPEHTLDALVLQAACYDDHFFSDGMIGEALLLLNEAHDGHVTMYHGYRSEGPAWDAFRLLEQRAKTDKLAAKLVRDRQGVR